MESHEEGEKEGLPDNSIVIFKGKGIRRAWHNHEWWFSVFDIVAVLTDSSDTKQYIKKMRSRDSALNSKWGTICTPLELMASDGKKRLMNCVNTEGAFRVIQSIPSPKAEPFKLWLAKVGHERVREIENPELAQERMKKLFKSKGYSEEWIEKRVRGIAIRDELTDEWRKRGLKSESEYAILTSEISKAAFGLTPSGYKKLKGLKKENLRDHMDDIELVLTMLGEATTTRLTRDRDSIKFRNLKTDAKDGGEVAGSARKGIEQKLGKNVVCPDNFLEKPEKLKRLEHRKKKK
ncbi:MAG TPA: phage antirepressor protein [Candidatus Woesearchaeota archaeon]|nr:phage antirepressor protein [Candidatus Woesearchaeota archaeon]